MKEDQIPDTKVVLLMKAFLEAVTTLGAKGVTITVVDADGSVIKVQQLYDAGEEDLDKLLAGLLHHQYALCEVATKQRTETTIPFQHLGAWGKA